MNCDFVKSHGLGNDYIVMLKDERTPSLTVRNIRLLCDRNYGVGSDGILLLEKDSPPFGLRIFNPDGSEAEKSGNGLRIFSKFLYEYGFAKEKEFLIDTAGGRVRSSVRTDQSGRVTSVLVEMGTYTFDPAVVGIKERNTPLIEEAISLDGKVSVTGSAVSVGNPHFVFFVEKIDEPFIREFGTLIEHHPLFPRRINTQMVRVVGPNEIEIRIWERGAGYTQASGSSSCAAASCAVFLGKVKSPVTVRMPCGTLLIEVGEKGDLRMEGPVEEVMTGNFSRDFLERLKNNNG